MTHYETRKDCSPTTQLELALPLGYHCGDVGFGLQASTTALKPVSKRRPKSLELSKAFKAK